MTRKNKPGIKGACKLKRSRCKEISDKVMEDIVQRIVEKNMGLREIAFRLNIRYSVLIKHITENQAARDMIDEARHWAVFDTSQTLIDIADQTTKETIDKDRFRIQARKDSVNMISRYREMVARSRPPESQIAPTINVGVVLVPAKAMAPAAPGLAHEQPRLAAINGQLVGEMDPA